MPQLISYAQNGEDVRLWHAFGPTEHREEPPGLTYVDVGANQPRELSLTAALYDLGWRGILVEADPDLACELRRFRPQDQVVEAAAAGTSGELAFYRVPGTGLGTLDASQAQAARDRGFAVEETSVACRPLDDILDEHLHNIDGKPGPIHAMSIDVEGAEGMVLEGLSLTTHRPWVMCIEAVEPGTTNPSHATWERHLLRNRYRFIAFDGINRWYVAEEHADQPVCPTSAAPPGTTIAGAIATPLNAIDAGVFGWRSAHTADLEHRDHRNHHRQAWQRELILNDLRHQVPTREYERQIDELRTALVGVEGSRTFSLSRKISGLGKRVLYFAHRIRRALPGPIDRALIRHRHLKHVTVNMKHLTNAAYLGAHPSEDIAWLSDAERPPLPPGMQLAAFGDIDEVNHWLATYPWDRDDQLDGRMDNHDDEVGRVRAALRSRLRLHNAPTNPFWAGGKRVAFDARALQSPAFGNRGIGRFAKAALIGAREAVGDERITLIIDRGLHQLPAELVGACEQVTSISEADVAQFSVLIQPSPMTHSPDPLIALLHSNAYRLAVVFDFIPMHYPSVYLNHPAARLEYAANLDALKRYSDYVCISQTVRRELADVLGRPRTGPEAMSAIVAWPREVLAKDELDRVRSTASKHGPIVLMTGDEPRKNTFGGLAGIAAATSDALQRDVVVIGMADQPVRVHHWSIAAAMRPGEAVTAGRMSDEELGDLLSRAACVVVPSFDEGLSLPVIEAVRAGAPVVVSGIATHRELVGKGMFTCNPMKPRSIARAVRRTRGRKSIHRRQKRTLGRHSHTSLEAVVAKMLLDHVRPAEVGAPAPTPPSGRRLRVGVATPWNPQRTGVADFSTTVFTELAHHVELTVYTTADADVVANPEPHVHIEHRAIDELFADPVGIQKQHDVLICVVGNSHYHLPFVSALAQVDALAIAHDTRMVEYYMALRGVGGAAQLMLTTADPHAPKTIEPPLDDQIDDMRLLQNAGFWEIANRAQQLIVHSPSAAPRIAQETGKPIYVLPFANQRFPSTPTVTDADRRAARERLGLSLYDHNTIHLGSFGYVDTRTKMTDVVLEVAGWLTQWGHHIALHLIGAARDDHIAELTERARKAGIAHFHVTGFQSEEQFRDWLMAVDMGVQLRVSPLLGVSGPLSDLAAFGTPAVASNGLCVDVDTPEYITRLPDAISPVIVAEAIEEALQHPMPPDSLEQARQAYLARQSPQRYAQLLLELIKDAAT